MTNKDLVEEMENIFDYIQKYGKCTDCGIDTETPKAILARITNVRDSFEIPEGIDERRRHILQSVKDGKTYQEIADETGVVRQRIGQIVKSVCKKTKKLLPEKNV